jgi:hypothetical protein
MMAGGADGTGFFHGEGAAWWFGLAAGRLNVGDAGRRYVDLLYPLRDDLAVRKAATKGARPGGHVFPTAKGNAGTINNVRERACNPAVRWANANLERNELGVLPTA